MKAFGRITLRTFCRATEEREKVAKALLFAACMKDPRAIVVTTLEGYGGSSLEVLEIEILRQQAIKRFWNSMPKEVIQEVMETLDKRLDDEQVLHFRIDKERAYLGDIALNSRGAVISVDAKVLSYPANRVEAVKNARTYLRGVLNKAEEQG